MEKFNITGFIEYQEKDCELYNLERKLYNSKEFTEMKKLENEVNVLKSQRAVCMSEAKEILADFKDKSAKIADLTNEHIHTNFDKFDETEDIVCEEEILREVLAKLEKAEKEYRAKNSTASALMEKLYKIEKLRKDDMEKAVKVKGMLEAVKKEVLAEGAPINEQLFAMRKSLDPTTLQCYMNIRKTKGHPVLAEMIGPNCSRCGMDIHIEMKDLKPGEAAECPNCGRLVYIAGGNK